MLGDYDFLDLLAMADRMVRSTRRAPRGSRLQRHCQNIFSLQRTIAQKKRLYVPSAEIRVAAKRPKMLNHAGGFTSWPLHGRPRISVFPPPNAMPEELKAWFTVDREVSDAELQKHQQDLNARAVAHGIDPQPIEQVSDDFAIAILSDDIFHRIIMHEVAHVLVGPYAAHDKAFQNACWLIGSCFGFTGPQWCDDAAKWPISKADWKYGVPVCQRASPADCQPAMAACRVE